MRRAIREHLRDFAAIIGLLIIAGGVSAVILTHQRFRFPFIQDKPKRLYAEISTGQAVTPGQGQTVEVAGVKIGLIANVKLVDGHARIGLDIDPKFKDVVHTDGVTGLLRPRTGLKDMFLQLDPGDPKSPVAKSGFTIPVASNAPDVNLDEFLGQLDNDTREHLQLLLGGAAEGLKGRGMDLSELFRRFGPTARDLRRVDEAVAVEREGVKDSIHGLALLTDELAHKQNDLSQLVDSSAAVFEALGSEDRNVSATVHKLPGALQVTTQTLGDLKAFADQLGPTTAALTPTFQTLEQTNRIVTPIALRITPIIRDQVRPFVREAQPLVSNLRVAAGGLSSSLPDLTRAFVPLNHLFNLLGYNPNGREGKGVAGRDEGYSFYLAWLTHQTENLINIDDANGPMRPVFLTGTCQTITNLVNSTPALEFALGLSGLLAQQCNNPQTRSLDVAATKARLARQLDVAKAVQQGTADILGGGGQ
ncbi:MAG: phospholipid/cholesterol/gamma-HCH transport system substrate-binding protein [Solirubrobacteraceae bacterium]|jgi:phospholipid/cholesterol/gamma-HCH transport system substrate-binding protein|nr:phospholipid/cholesterol/gamma-HCH transport system substrate-binding protein [Solirubrobacteraceae bacterium]